MAQALPSFVELLDSLDLESEGNSEGQHYAHYPNSPSFISSSPSSSLPSLPSSQASSARFLNTPNSSTSFASPSPSIVISQPSPVDDSVASRRRSILNRYSPYVPPSVLTRRSSLPGDLMNHHDFAIPRTNSSRSCSASPPSRRAFLGHDSLIYLSTSRITMSKSDQPISALVRRRQPHCSPQSSEFHKPPARRSISPAATLTPMSLPSLPPLPPISAKLDSPLPLFSAIPHSPSIVTLDHSWDMSPKHDVPSPGTTSPHKPWRPII